MQRAIKNGQLEDIFMEPDGCIEILKEDSSSMKLASLKKIEQAINK